VRVDCKEHAHKHTRTHCPSSYANIHIDSCDNCHSHVAYALNDLGYGGYKKWNMVQLAFWVFFKGKFNSFSDVVKTFGPFSVIVLVIILVKL